MFRWMRPVWFMVPDEGGSGGGGGQAPPAAPAGTAPSPGAAGGGGSSTPASPPVPSAPGGGGQPANPAAAALAAAGAGGQQRPAPGATPPAGQPNLGAAPANAQTPAGQSDFLSIRDAAAQYGFPMQGVTDDHAALQQLILMARQGQQQNQLANIGQQILPHMSAFQQWQAQQRQQQQQAQQQSWHKAPEFDPSWVNMIAKDPQTGDYKPVPGAPPDIVQRLTQARMFQQQFQERFAQDPIGTIKAGLEPLIREIAGQVAEQNIGQYRDTSYGEGFIREHSNWLHSRDQGGQVLRDHSGAPVLSPLGSYFREQLGAAVNMGIRSEKDRAAYALGQVRAAYMQEQLRQQQAGGAGDAAKAALLQQQQQFQQAGQQTPPNAAGTLTNSQTPNGQLPPKAPKLILADRLRASLKQAGVTDAMVNGAGRRA